MLYLVLAHDGTDPEAPERRRRVRQQHLEGLRPAIEAGELQLGGALLAEDGTMIGSALIVEAESASAARDFIHNDIYHRSGVWRRIEIYPFQRAV